MKKARLGIIVVLGLGVVLGSLALALGTSAFGIGQEPPTVQANDEGQTAFWLQAKEVSVEGDFVRSGWPIRKAGRGIGLEYRKWLVLKQKDVGSDCQMYFVPRFYGSKYLKGTIWADGREISGGHGTTAFVCHTGKLIVGVEFFHLNDNGEMPPKYSP